MYSNFFETRKEMQQGIKILKRVLVDFQRKENTSKYICVCLDWCNSERFPAHSALKNWIRAQINGKFSYGHWLADYYPKILVKEGLVDGYSADCCSYKSREARILWIKHMISVLKKYLDDNKVEKD